MTNWQTHRASRSRFVPFEEQDDTIGGIHCMMNAAVKRHTGAQGVAGPTGPQGAPGPVGATYRSLSEIR